MDWYLLGRILGVVCWPLAAAALVYGVAWLIGLSRAREREREKRYWVHVAAALAYFIALFVTGLHLLRYLGLVG